MRKAGVTEGEMLPRWGVALMLLLFPSRIRLWIGADLYDVMSDTIRVGKVRLSLHWLERTFERPSRPGYWFRVKEITESGLTVIEERTDGYIVSDSPLSGCHSCRWGGVATARHAECRDCRPPEWKGWEAKKTT
jgi:hypothetical protein